MTHHKEQVLKTCNKLYKVIENALLYLSFDEDTCLVDVKEIVNITSKCIMIIERIRKIENQAFEEYQKNKENQDIEMINNSPEHEIEIITNYLDSIKK